ncbi:MAG TPA: four helix bundle protein [Gemmatales bacterium]|nr:four helix bundle protein [Gemmatales bacterium]HMP17912.1 four helix bundle protein [Gemmatales bacterium]
MRLHQPDLRNRTKTASLHALAVYRTLPETEEARILGKRMFRMITRAGAHYRAAVRSRSLRSYLKRIDAALYDLDLGVYWLDLMIAAEHMGPRTHMNALLSEVHEIMAILVSCKKSVRKRDAANIPISSN